MAEIARRAGVSRLTVYNHFADLSELIPACAGHYGAQHPMPDLGAALELDEPGERVGTALTALYGWYRETESMFGKLFSDRFSVPELDRYMEENIDRMQAGLADGTGGRLRRPRAARGAHTALTRLAVDFWTWRRLSSDGLDDRAAADLMATAVAAGAAAA